MGKIIYLPTFYLTRHTDNYKFLFTKMQDEMGFDIVYTDDPKIPKNSDIIISYAIPHWNFKSYPIEPFVDLPRRIKLIVWMRDLQTFGDPICTGRAMEMFERADLILHFAKQQFSEMYPQFVHKSIYVPQWFASYARYDLPANNKPIMKCLLSGEYSGKCYPLRSYVTKNANPELIDTIRGGKFAGGKLTGDEYAKLLHSYFACLATGLIFKYAVAKYVEIPAAGSLLLAETLNDSLEMGFEPWVHYVPVSADTVLSQIAECLESSEKYRQIARQGKEFVWRKHGLGNRFELMRQILADL